MNKKIEEILESIGNELLTPEVKADITGAFAAEVESRVTQSLDEKVKLSVDAALEQADTEYAAKIVEFAEKMDKSHVATAEKMVENIDRSYGLKLKQVADAYKQELTENVDAFQKTIIAKVSNFVDMRLDKLVPVEQLEEAVKNINATRVLGEIKKLLAFSPEELGEDVKNAVKESYDTIESLKGEFNGKVKELMVVESELKAVKAEKILTEKTAGFSPKKLKYVTKALKGKDPEFITENFDYVVGMFEEVEKDDKETVLTEEIGKSVSNTVAVPKMKVEESIQRSNGGNEVEGYAEELRKLHK